MAVELATQLELGKRDFDAGRYEIARQRLEYVLERQPDYPGAMELLTQTIFVMMEVENNAPLAIDRPTLKPSPTLSPTVDTRAIDEIYRSALERYQLMDWRSLVQTLITIRDIDPLYQVEQVDRMMYLSHYFNGVDKILVEGDLEGGLYDLSLAELFAPLDSQAEVYKEWAYLYQIGMSFWSVYPDRSAFYFSQLAAAAPYLKDLSGIAAVTRYRLSLIMYGDLLAEGEEWCEALIQYNLAQGIYYDQEIEAIISKVDEQCQYSIASPTLTFTWTETPSLTPTTGTVTWTTTSTPMNTATIAFSGTPTMSSTTVSQTPTEMTPSPTMVDTQTPTITETGTTTATGTNTATATATSTATENQASETPTPTQSPLPTEEVEP